MKRTERIKILVKRKKALERERDLITTELIKLGVPNGVVCDREACTNPALPFYTFCEDHSPSDFNSNSGITWAANSKSAGKILTPTNADIKTTTFSNLGIVERDIWDYIRQTDGF